MCSYMELPGLLIYLFSYTKSLLPPSGYSHTWKTRGTLSPTLQSLLFCFFCSNAFSPTLSLSELLLSLKITSWIIQAKSCAAVSCFHSTLYFSSKHLSQICNYIVH